MRFLRPTVGYIVTSHRRFMDSGRLLRTGSSSLRVLIALRGRDPRLILWDLLRLVIATVWFCAAALVLPVMAIRRIVTGCWLAIAWMVRPRHAATVLLILSLCESSTVAAPQTLVAVTTEWRASLGFWLNSNGIPAKVYGTLAGQNPSRPRPQEKQRERDARVSRIQIHPGDVTVQVDEAVRFAAVGYDQDGVAIGGVTFKWSANDDERNRAVRISPRGEFEAARPGTYKVTAEGAGRQVHVKVRVVDGSRRPKSSDRPTRTQPVSNRERPGEAGQAANSSDNEERSNAKRSARQRGKSGRSGDSTQTSTRAASAFAHKTGAGNAALMPQGGGGGWNSSNYWSSSDPGNGVGDPPGVPAVGGAGSGTFQITAPIYGAASRGIDISLGLTYNSRLWNKAWPQFSFDNDRGWPAPGWSIGFGKILGMGTGPSMIVDADGTRHNFKGTVQWYGYGYSGTFTAHTSDGTFIDYSHWMNYYGWIMGGQARLANGTFISYGAHGPGGVFPTYIEDANGNYITITYVNNAGPQIQTVTDSMNRVITFHYDANNLPTAITGPGLNNTTRTLVRLHYRQLALNYSFASGTQVVVENSYPWVIDAISYPATGTGYWFGDSASTGYQFGASDSYSTYGMLAKVVEVRGMTFSGPEPAAPAQGPTGQGTITSAGQLTRKEVYNYPLFPGDNSGTQSSNLTNAPTYTTMNETWTTDGTNTDQAVTQYAVNEEGSPRTVTITFPNGTKSTQYSYNYTSLPDSNPLKALDGLAYLDETYVTPGSPLKSSSSTWEKGAYDSPRPTSVVATNNEIGKKAVTTFAYDSAYNQVTRIYNYEYVDLLGTPSVLLGTTHNEYQNSSSYTNRHIFNLLSAVEIYAGDDATRVSRTEYQYDGQTLTDAPGVIMHSDVSNPYALPLWIDGHWGDQVCDEFNNCWYEWIEGYYEPIYNSSTDYRGNVTLAKQFADAINLGGPVTESRYYDITGNLVKASSSCCQQTTFKYGTDADPAATQYGYVVSQTRGSATDPYAQSTTSATYDFSTGLALSATDANGWALQTSYDPATLRPTTVISATGAHTDYAYNDTAMTVAATTYLTGGVGGAIASQSLNLFNGHGQMRQEQARAPDEGGNQKWDCVDTTFDNMGLPAKQTRPYRCGTAAPNPSLMIYDSLGRTKKAIAPDYTVPAGTDGSTTENFYNETSRPPGASTAAGETTRVRDAWGRERWGLTDAQGRLVQVAEPNPDGSGSVFDAWALLTSYTYDTLGNLTLITEDAQTRSFKYDSLGRLIAQKLAETGATLNSSGVYIGAGGQWSDYFTYDERSNLTSRTDARGVKTLYSYLVGGNLDPLNRLQSVTYDLSGPHENLSDSPILSAASVSYLYRQKTAGQPNQLRNVTQLEKITTSEVSTETYGFDDFDRVNKQTLKLDTRQSYPMITDYTYDALDRITHVYYPGKNLSDNTGRRHLQPYYDIASRLTSLTVDDQNFASEIKYNAASQTEQLKVGVSGTNQVTENYTYETQTGLLASQNVQRNGSTLLNLAYEYTNANGKRTGQLTKVLDSPNHNKDRSYTYDALGRLSQLKGGVNGALWSETYAYDRFGNRLSVTPSGYSARNGTGVPTMNGAREALATTGAVPPTASAPREPSDPKVILPTEQLALRTNPEIPGDNGANAARGISDSPFSVFSSTPRATKLGGSSPQGPTNLALNKPATESSIHNGDRWASRAVDGNTDGALWDGYASGTNYEYQSWWQVDLQSSQSIGAIEVWGRTDCCPEMTSNYYVLVSDQPFVSTDLATARAQAGVSSYYVPGYSGTPGTLNVNRTGRYVRVQLASWQYLVLAEVKVFQATSSLPIPADGITSLSYQAATNRITTSGFSYDAAGNQVRALAQTGGSQRFRYDAANRLVQVLADDNTTVLASYTYGDSNERLISTEWGLRTYYVSDGGTTIAEYFESGSSTTPTWSRSYVYLGARLLSTLTSNGSGGEAIQFHHPDRLGTRLVTDPASGTSFEQMNLPYGSPLNAESTGSTNRRFTSYDRSPTTGLDYAINRHYDARQGRFTQVDPAGLSHTSLENPQSLNLYAYCTNDPVNHADPSGLGFLSWLNGVFKRVVHAFIHAVITAVFTFLQTLITTGNLHAALVAGAAAGVADFLKQLGWPSKGYGIDFGRGTPQWNPQSVSILRTGPSGLSRYIIYNLANPADKQIPLSGDLLALFLEQRDRLVKLLKDKDSDCAKYIREKFGVDGTRLAKALMAQRPFNGETSTLGMGAAGLVKKSDGLSLYYLRVKGFFKRNPGTNAITGLVLRARIRDVYYRENSIAAPRMLHETIHYFLGLDDPAIKTILGVKGPSSKITEDLANHGCK